jgi:hypothetical protein
MRPTKLQLNKETLLVLEDQAAQVAGAGTKYCGYTVTCEASKGNNTCNCATVFCSISCGGTCFCFPGI